MKLRPLFTLALAALATVVLAANYATPVRAAGCDPTAFSFSLAPYESRTFNLCAWGNAAVTAESANGADIDGRMVDDDGWIVAEDTDYTGVVWLSSSYWYYGNHHVRYTITNTTGRTVYVRVHEADVR